MLNIAKKPSFDHDIKRFVKKHFDMESVYEAIELLARQDILPGKYRNHSLVGNWAGYKEIHIKPDVLLIYKIAESEIILVRLGSHDELFKR